MKYSGGVWNAIWTSSPYPEHGSRVRSFYFGIDEVARGAGEVHGARPVLFH